MPRSTQWRLDCDGTAALLMIEATGDAFGLPDKGPVGQHAIYDPAILDHPGIDKLFQAQYSERETAVVVKRQNTLTTITYPFNPLDAVGWHGDLDSVYNSRTFCLFEDVEKIKRLGLGRGGSLENAVVVGDDKVLNEGGLRYKDEFVMHKILDCMGDLMLANHKILGKVKCSQGGHQLTNALLKKFLSDSQYFSVVEFKEKKLPNSSFYSRPVAASA